MANKEINPSVITLVDFIKEHPNTPYTFAELAAAAGVKNATAFIRGMKEQLGDSLEVGTKFVDQPKTLGVFTYNAPTEKYERKAKSEPSEKSLAVANYFAEHEGEGFTLVDLTIALGFDVLSGHLSGARSILGKENIVRSEKTIMTPVEKTSYTYIGD